MIDSRRSEVLKVFLGITGASGCVLAIRFAELLKKLNSYIVASYTSNALLVADSECVSREWFISKLGEYVDELYDENRIDASIASSSNTLDVYTLIPASIKTLALIVNGIGSNLITRAILNGLRMKRKVIAIVRESPLGEIELKILYRAARAGIIIIPAVIGFYTYPQNLGDIVDFIIGKVFDVLELQHSLYRRWKSAKESKTQDPCQILYGSKDS
ncbi:MAG: UbiX family flavin prenyltransferase [Ignisphaera sp.]